MKKETTAKVIARLVNRVGVMSAQTDSLAKEVTGLRAQVSKNDDDLARLTEELARGLPVKSLKKRETQVDSQIGQFIIPPPVKAFMERDPAYEGLINGALLLLSDKGWLVCLESTDFEDDGYSDLQSVLSVVLRYQPNRHLDFTLEDHGDKFFIGTDENAAFVPGAYHEEG